jgi:molybdenum cofactor cytidylyltransferase
MTIAAVVLAAGRSTRMGGVDKLLAEIEGTPMVRRVVAAAIEAKLHPVLVVTGPDEKPIGAALHGLDVTMLANPEAADGLSTSLKIGIGGLPQGLDGAMVLLGDMPLVTGALLRRLVAAFEAEPGGLAAVPLHAGEWGNPVILAPALFPDVGTLTGDAGARRLLEARRDVVIEVPVSDEAVAFDVDTPAALEEARVKAAERI